VVEEETGAEVVDAGLVLVEVVEDDVRGALVVVWIVVVLVGAVVTGIHERFRSVHSSWRYSEETVRISSVYPSHMHRVTL